MNNGLKGSVFVISLLFLGSSCKEKEIDFSAEVKPILNKHCISCHGGVKKSGNFSVLFRDEALDTTESGKFGIIPGDAQHSEMIRRILSKDPEERMPYKEEPLAQHDIEILTKWIKQGAKWGDHWAYVAPKDVHVPKPNSLLASISSEDEWAKTEIDYFILDKLREQDLEPSVETDKATLVRRIYLDIIGLPPTVEQANNFLKDENPDAYEKVVNELLTSPHFGEKWASWWLDLARYSDTKGYERDVERTIWRYRDWVIKAFNEDMPFDQFTREQLAGDLLKNPTDDQLIATAFHRNTMNNDEGGTEDEEFRVAALMDRVSTTWEIWQSTTMSCVQCHTHPYDPFRFEEYYESMAFFNNTRDEDTEGEHPNLRSYEEKDVEKLEEIKTWVRHRAGNEKENDIVRFLKTIEPKYHPHDFDEFINGELIDTKWLGIRSGGSARLNQINLTGKTHLIMNYSTDQLGGSLEIRKGKLNGDILSSTRLDASVKRKAISIPLKSVEGKHDLYFIFKNPSIDSNNPVCAVEWFAFREDLPGKDSAGYDIIARNFMHLLNTKVDKTPIMIENSKDQYRTTHIFERGNWLVKGDVVVPGVPKSLNPFPEGQPYNRLGFANWLLSKENPLTARTIVNRFWEQIFGYGLVETLEDFGTQGSEPTHQGLLDWLALRLMNEHQWSMKKLVKDMVMSATYRQDSRVTEELLQKDPSNQFLARGPRVRLSAEQIRDQALAVSGLLSGKMYGKSVMPYQPNGIWSSVWNGATWKESEGEDRFRRSVYTFLKRTSPYPALIMFDGSSREICVSRRIRTNTPLQALVTLNDSSFIVAARSLAEKMLKTGKSSADQIESGYKMLLVRDIPEDKLEILNGLYEQALKQYRHSGEATKQFIAADKPLPQLAAMTIVANAMMNLDEVLTKE
jgi:hypothetical protein